MLHQIDILTAEEGDTVTFNGIDPEAFSHLVSIDCVGFWTNWIDRRFIGNTHLECLEQAVKERSKSK